MSYSCEVSEGNKNTQHIHSVPCPVAGKAGVMDCLSSGNASLTPFSDPFPVWHCVCSPVEGEIVPVCSLLLYGVFFQNITIPFLSSSQVMFQVGWQSTVRSYRQSRKFVSSVQKHVLTVCATSGGIFTPEAILFCSHMTQYSWQVLFARPAKPKHILHKWNQKKKRSYVAIVSRILSREAVWHQSGAIFSRPVQKQKVTLWQL